jgi:uncharacterized membrane protein
MSLRSSLGRVFPGLLAPARICAEDNLDYFPFFPGRGINAIGI